MPPLLGAGSTPTASPPAGGWTLPPEGFHWVGESGVEQKPDPEPEDDGRGRGKYASFYGKPIKGFREGAVGPVPTGERIVPVVVEEWPTGAPTAFTAQGAGRRAQGVG